MRKSMKSLLAVILLATPLVLTSCEGALDDVLGEWSRPTPGNNNNNNNNTNTTPSTDMTNKYRVWNGSDYDTPDIPSTAIDASTITNTINAGFYDVKGDVNLSGTITLAGDAEFLLRDGATFKISGAIVDNNGTYNLKIYAQSEGTGMGKLDITNSSASDYPITVSKLTIHGGEIIASNTGGTAVNLAGGFDMLGGKLTASAISTAIMVYGGPINVVKGTIDAQTSGHYIAAINASGIDITVLGGTVKATTSGGGGGSCIKVGGDFTVYDGEIDAQATSSSYGIFASGADKKFTVSGGTVTAKSGAGGNAAIYVANVMEVNDGTINATAGANGDGISVLNNSNATTPVFIVSGGNITAIGGNATTVNGRYGIHIYGDSKITGGTINATGGDATGYPGGAGFSSYNIYLAGCSVVAIGGDGTYSSGVLGTINFTTGSAKGCADGTSWNITYTTGEYPNNQYFKYE